MCAYNFVVLLCITWARQLREPYVFLATRQLYFNCIVKYYILVFWQNKVMMMMMTQFHATRCRPQPANKINTGY